MSNLKIKRIKSYLEKTFEDKIDLSDYSKKSEVDIASVALGMPVDLD